jgi:hypothetical protein
MEGIGYPKYTYEGGEFLGGGGISLRRRSAIDTRDLEGGNGGCVGGGCRASPEGIGGAGGVGEVLELSGHGLDESHGEALLGKIEVRGRV